MANELKMQVVFSMMEKITAPLKKISSGAKDTGKALKDTSDRLRELNKQQNDLNGLRELHQGMRKTSAELATAQQRVTELAAKMKATENPTRAMTREFNAAVRSVKSLQEASEKQGIQYRALRERLTDAGIGSRQLANAQTWLKNSIAATNAELADQQKKLTASHRQQQVMANARQRADKLRSTAGGLAAAGVGATASGAAVGAPILAGLKEAKHYETENGRVRALGLGPSATAEAIKFAREMKTYGTSQLDNLQLLRDGITAFGDTHHAEMVAPMMAKMKFGNHAFFGEAEGAENERKFMDALKVIEERGGTSSQEAFSRQANMMQRVITATGGRVGPTEWLNFIKTGGVAAKIMDDESFYYQMEPLVQMMGGHRAGTALMSGYQNLYQGRTTHRAVANLGKLGLIGDQSKVTFDKAGQIATLGPGALLGSEVFRRSQFEWIETVLLPQLKKKGITDPRLIEDTIAGLFTNRTAANLYIDMYRQRAQIHKNAKINAGAADIDELDKLGRETASGKELEALAKLADLKLEMGTKILPLYASGLQMAANAMQALTGFMERNPATANAMIVGFSAIAAILVVMGPLMLALASVIGPYALLQVLFAKIGLEGNLLMPTLRAIGTVSMWIGRFFLTNPIGLAITAIAAAAYLLYQNWTPIKEFFLSLWSKVKSAFMNGVTSITQFLMNWTIVGFIAEHWEDLRAITLALWDRIKLGIAAVVGGITDVFLNWTLPGLVIRHWDAIRTAAATVWAVIRGIAIGVGEAIVNYFLNWTLPGLIVSHWSSIIGFLTGIADKFSTIGRQIMDGLVTGLIDGAKLVKETINGIGESVIDWFKVKLNIHSPSRVFAELGDYTMQGLAVGLNRGQDGPLSAVSSLAGKLASAGAAVAIGAGSVPAMAFDSRPPINGGSAHPVIYQGDTVQIIIQPAPGMDEQAIARAVAAELDRRDRMKASRQRSNLADWD
ncbi:hypothetical protein J2S30_002016 [Herbaspirillum rubrisubalbicans]|uniref:phage tail tape measure protein n=1 Tax=Herbaspirillum rubrisubalbicans TaxID=80842 RepID=UPI0020A1974D|nr:phage tail protein [Herbaspirillum rubrisubalbicans]MCP1573637.1 hypothetical protein [Herbaspirillum rubrisubalbicans]